MITILAATGMFEKNIIKVIEYHQQILAAEQLAPEKQSQYCQKAEDQINHLGMPYALTLILTPALKKINQIHLRIMAEVDCAKVALILRDLLHELRLAGYVKTSGMKGLHVYVPLNHSETTFEDTKKFSKAVAEIMQQNYPDLVTAKMAKEYRRKRVFINWSQNDPSKTMICVYSLRARERPIVSFPLQWKDLDRLAARGEPEKLLVLHSEAVKRAEKQGDLFREVLTKKQRLPYL